MRACGEDGDLEVMGIGRDSVAVSSATVERLRALALATDTSVAVHVERALQAYLTQEGQRAAVVGFAERARQRYRAALDSLASNP
jgi:DNA-binding transcriptional MocR family regulator